MEMRVQTDPSRTESRPCAQPESSFSALRFAANIDGKPKRGDGKNKGITLNDLHFLRDRKAYRLFCS